jgi:hypothetical protein
MTIERTKKSLQQRFFPLYSAFTAQARESFVTRPERVFCRPGHEVFGGALFLENAHDQSAHSKRTPEGVGEIEVTGID